MFSRFGPRMFRLSSFFPFPAPLDYSGNSRGGSCYSIAPYAGSPEISANSFLDSPPALEDDARVQSAAPKPLDFSLHDEEQANVAQSSAEEAVKRAMHVTARTTIVNLPNEIVHHIFINAESSTLVNLSCTNHSFQAIAERIIYRKIGALSLAMTVRCLKTMSVRPHLARHTRSYEISDIDGCRMPFPAFFALLARVLRAMTQLTDLAILISGRHAAVLHGTTFRLQKVTSALHWDQDFTQWLNGQEELRAALFCGQYVGGTRLNSWALPKLSRVSGSPLILAAVVPGRPVKDVEVCLVHPWLFNADLMSTTLKIIKFSTGPLLSLQIISHLGVSSSNFLSAIGVVPQVLSQLESLALHAVSGSVSVAMLEGMDGMMPQFKALKAVTLLSKDQTDALHNFDIITGLAAKWHSGCPTLDCVSFPKATWVRNKKYGWVTLNDLERILAEREKLLQEREKGIQERERAIAAEHAALEEKERELQLQVARLRSEVDDWA